MSTLPSVNPFPPGSETRTAYDRVLTFTGALRWTEKAKLLCGRVIGYMLLELRWEYAQSKIAKEINDCPDDKALEDLGALYMKYFIRACK
jgi:hypothetical protein